MTQTSCTVRVKGRAPQRQLTDFCDTVPGRRLTGGWLEKPYVYEDTSIPTPPPEPEESCPAPGPAPSSPGAGGAAPTTPAPSPAPTGGGGAAPTPPPAGAFKGNPQPQAIVA